MLLLHRSLCVAFVAIVSVFALQHHPGRPHTIGTVLLAHPVLAFFGSAGLLLLITLAPRRIYARLHERSALLWSVPASLILIGVLWLGHEINDAFLAVALFALGPILATTIWSRAADDRRPLFLSTSMLSAAVLVFAVELSGSDHGRAVSVEWGDKQTFAMLFPKKPPYMGPGGRLRPNLDVYMNSKHLPQGARLQTNSLGFRNVKEIAQQPAPGTLRVLNLGDSFSIGMQIGQHEFLGPLVERELAELRAGAVEVVNAEISDPAYGLFFFQEFGHALGAKVVLIGLCANDMMQVDDSFGRGDDQRLFHLDDSRRLVPDPDPGMFKNHMHRYADLAYPVASERGATHERKLFAFDRFGRKVRGKFLRFRSIRLFAPNTARRGKQSMLMHSYTTEQEQEDGRKRYFDGVANLGYFVKDAPSVMDELYAKLFDVFGALDEQVRASGGTLVLVIHPQRFQVHSGDWDVIREVWDLAEEDFDLELPNRRLRDLCAERGILACDLLSAFRAETDGGSLYISGGDMHFNNAGHAVAAREVARFVHEELALE